MLALEVATTTGTSFVFGYLGGGDAPFEIKNEGMMFVLAFKALPLILVMSALSMLLYYYRILPAVVQFFSYLLQKSLNVSGSVGLSVAANAFVGMIESPLLIKPYLKNMTRGEIFSVMVAGMSTIAGSIRGLSFFEKKTQFEAKVFSLKKTLASNRIDFICQYFIG